VNWASNHQGPPRSRKMHSSGCFHQWQTKVLKEGRLIGRIIRCHKEHSYILQPVGCVGRIVHSVHLRQKAWKKTCILQPEAETDSSVPKFSSAHLQFCRREPLLKYLQGERHGHRNKHKLVGQSVAEIKPTSYIMYRK
jgi:hypothetical protein